MKMSCVILPLVVSVGVLMMAAPSVCLPTGAPTSACVTLMPGHGSQSPDPAPYRIYFTGKKNSGKRMKVTVDVVGNATYRGILMQMRELGSTEPVGRWMNVANNTRTLSCSGVGDSITHKNTMPKGKSTFTWIAPNWPKKQGYRWLVVRATIASGYTTWWMDVTSPIISASPHCSMPVYPLLVVAVLSTVLARLSE